MNKFFRYILIRKSSTSGSHSLPIYTSPLIVLVFKFSISVRGYWLGYVSRIDKGYKTSIEDFALLSPEVFSITSSIVSFIADSAISLACSAVLRKSSNISLILRLID
jgi:hypothetical protein